MGKAKGKATVARNVAGTWTAHAAGCSLEALTIKQAKHYVRTGSLPCISVHETFDDAIRAAVGSCS